jgi:hypothetical protein
LLSAQSHTCRPTSHLLDDLNLAIEARRPTLDQRHISRQTHFVHMSSCFEVVQGVEDEIEFLEPVDVEDGIFDVGMIRLELDGGIEFASSVFRDLFALISFFPLVL